MPISEPHNQPSSNVRVALHRRVVQNNEASDTAKTSAPREPVSLWLYLAGLCVTLSGLYAVNYGLDDQNFALLSYGMAICGYAVSYVLRLLRVPVQAVQVPLIVCLGLVFVAGISSEQGIGWFAPPGAVEDRAKSLQLVFVYIALVHTFVLSSDAVVLFACVPCMTMLALVSTQTAEPQVQNAFIVFIAASTFLMIHENYLRSRQAMMLGRSPSRERRLFGGQLQLAAFCVASSLILANFVAVPIRAVGQTIFLPGTITPLNTNNASNAAKKNSTPVVVNERSSIDLTGGAVTESTTPLLRVASNRGLYWRGSTFDYYTGRTFEMHTGEASNLTPTKDSNSTESGGAGFFSGTIRNGFDDLARFQIPTSPYELPDSEMTGSQECLQRVVVLNGTVTSLYGAGKVKEARVRLQRLQIDDAGEMKLYDRLITNNGYVALSQVPDDDPDHLAKASSNPKDVPEVIRGIYLQKHPDSQPDSAVLANLATQITKGKTNNYEKAEAIREYIANNCNYNLQVAPAPKDKDVVEYFLTEAHEGYCDRFAAAMTVLCRYAGIPTRLASGFLAGDIEKDGTYTVREKHKHLWTEVFFPKIGWVPFDATDGSKDVTDRSAKAKGKDGNFLAWLTSHGWLPPLLGLLALGMLAYVLKNELWGRLRWGRTAQGGLSRLSPTNIAVIEAYTAACALLAKRGLPRPEAMTPEEYRREVDAKTVSDLKAVRDSMLTLTGLHRRFRYGPEVATESDVTAAREALAALTAGLAQVKRGGLTIATADA